MTCVSHEAAGAENVNVVRSQKESQRSHALVHTDIISDAFQKAWNRMTGEIR